MLPLVQKSLKKNRPFTAYTLLSIGLLLAVLMLVLAACGSNTSSGGAPGPTPTTQTQLQQCGTVMTNPRGIPTDVPAATRVENCFWQAFQKCAPASLVYTLLGVDTATVRTFIVQASGNYCTVTDTVKHTMVPAPPTPLSAPATYTCAGVVQKSDGLRFSGCGQDGDIVVALQASNQ